MPLNSMQIQFKYLDIENCFKSFYVVPDYQREYVWEQEQVTQLMDDLFEEFEFNADKEYFIGSTVVFFNNDGLYEIIDGQQRTTTIFIILCAFRKLYDEMNMATGTIDGMLKNNTVNALGDTVEKYKLQLQYRETVNIIADLVAYTSTPINLKGSAKRLYAAFEIAYSFLKDIVTKNGHEQKLKYFFVYVYRKLKFIQIETPEINDALKIFETINERGVGLNPMDLLKNLLFRQVEQDDFEEVKQEWKSLIKTLEQHNEKPLRFLRYFIMANYNVLNTRGEAVIREEEIYKWFIKEENASQVNYESAPFEFLKKLLDNARCYVNYARGYNEDGGANVALDNIRKLGGGGFKQHLILLLAARKMPQQLFNQFAQKIETLVFYYFMTREQTKEFERNFARWARELRTIQTQEALDHFVSQHFEPVIRNKENEFRLRFLEARQNNLQQYRLRYIIARIAQFVDQQRLGSHEPKPLDHYLAKGVEIEHILPFNPMAELRASIGEEYDDLKIRLGNLTLLEKSMNVVVGNDFFDKKVIEYAKSPFYLTKSIASFDVVGIDTAINRGNMRLLNFSTWNKEAIQQRQEMLHALAKEIWTL